MLGRITKREGTSDEREARTLKVWIATIWVSVCRRYTTLVIRPSCQWLWLLNNRVCISPINLWLFAPYSTTYATYIHRSRPLHLDFLRHEGELTTTWEAKHYHSQISAYLRIEMFVLTWIDYKASHDASGCVELYNKYNAFGEENNIRKPRQ